MTIEPLIHHLVPFTLVAFRIAGLFIAAPMISSPMIPARVKVLAALALAGCVYPLTPAWPLDPKSVSILELAPMVVGEALIGYVIAESDVLSQMLMFTIFAGYLAGGGLESIFAAIVGTFERVGPGGIGFSDAPLAVVLGVFASGLEVAMRLSLPIVAAILLLVVVFAVIAKTMPAINIMSVGFTVKVLAGLLVLTLAMPVIARVGGEEIADVMSTIHEWSQTLATGGRHG